MLTNLNYVSNKVDKVLSLLNDSTNLFALTGSRYFEMNNENSDYDFFVLNSPGVANELITLGFKLVPRTGHKYNDPSVQCVYRHPAGVDVQLIHEEYIESKHRINDFLKSPIGLEMLKHFKSKSDRRELWSHLIMLTM